MLHKLSCNFHSNCQNTLWTHISRSLTFVMFDNARKNRPKSFLHWKGCLFFQNSLSSTTSNVLQKWSCNVHNKSQNTLRTVLIFALRIVIPDNARKNRPKASLLWAGCLFSKFCVFNNLIDVTEMILYLPQ